MYSNDIDRHKYRPIHLNVIPINTIIWRFISNSLTSSQLFNSTVKFTLGIVNVILRIILYKFEKISTILRVTFLSIVNRISINIKKIWPTKYIILVNIEYSYCSISIGIYDIADTMIRHNYNNYNSMPYILLSNNRSFSQIFVVIYLFFK